MEDSFDLPVEYKGQQHNFKARLLKLGYIHKFEVEVDGHQLFIEKDEEGNFRAVLANIESENQIDKKLVKAIVESLEQILK